MATLNDTTDAMVWAEEFCRIFKGHQIVTTSNTSAPTLEEHGMVDEGTMVAWFANAIEVGRNAGRQETCPHVDTFDIDDTLKCCRCGFLIQVGTGQGMTQSQPSGNPQTQSQGKQQQGNARDTMRQFADQVKQDIQSLGIGEDVKQQISTKLDQRLDEMGSKLG